jgi:hypothetical protein
MTTIQIQELARVGAEARLRAIGEERQALLQAFPDLGNGARPSPRASSPAAARPSRKRSVMSPAQRRVVGERMKAYWAKRRAENAGMDTPQAASASEAVTPALKQPSKRKPMSPGRKAQAEKMRAYWAARRAEKQSGSEKRAGRKTESRK